MSADKVTIVIPVRNRVSLLPRLFSSLDGVDYPPLEVIIVDNGSTDDTLHLCQQFAAKSRHEAMVLLEPIQGANRARNTGLQAAGGEWVCFFDSDDEFSPDFLSCLMPHAQRCDMLAFPTQMERDGKVWTRDFVPSGNVASQIITSTLNTHGIIWRTDFLRTIGGWNEDLDVWQDWELAVRALSHHPNVVWYTERAFHLIHLGNNSITSTTSATDRYRSMLSVLPYTNSPKEKRALYLRCQILSGQSHTSLPSLPLQGASLCTRMLGSFLRLCTRLGIRGTWRIALWFTA